MEKFNIALLAKQGWRLLSNTSSLAYRVLKARYFPNTTFLNAKLGWNPSFVWRSILRARGTLKQGIRWRVGNGSDILVYEDKWVPDIAGFCPRYTSMNLPSNTRVVDLMVEGTRCWNVSLIWDAFVEAEAKAILQIPLCRIPMQDILVWHFDRSGCYSVRSGYKLLCDEDEEMQEENCLVKEEDRLALRETWKANVPPKVRIFGWRLYHVILPVMDNLAKRKIKVDRYCFRCHNEIETISHAIRECVFSKEVWTLIEHFLQNDERSATVDNFALAMVTAWAIWGQGMRNFMGELGRGLSKSLILQKTTWRNFKNSTIAVRWFRVKQRLEEK